MTVIVVVCARKRVGKSCGENHKRCRNTSRPSRHPPSPPTDSPTSTIWRLEHALDRSPIILTLVAARLGKDHPTTLQLASFFSSLEQVHARAVGDLQECHRAHLSSPKRQRDPHTSNDDPLPPSPLPQSSVIHPLAYL
ncbi:hypothetical protein BASA81_003543 [Batrachochytrium salamandrivorans]|nr:hypothetical protein BASA81_003543 [Batrachochytrium salamandrivorans]